MNYKEITLPQEQFDGTIFYRGFPEPYQGSQFLKVFLDFYLLFIQTTEFKDI